MANLMAVESRSGEVLACLAPTVSLLLDTTRMASNKEDSELSDGLDLCKKNSVLDGLIRKKLALK
jgi:hypothetical protein